MNRPPSTSVVMAVHNGEPYLAESIESILTQTLSDFEFVILDDASTDQTPEILREWARRDHRIRLIASSIQLGLAGSANRVVHEARGEVCARMDADDVSHPDRLRRQWGVLRASHEVSMVGTLWEGIDARGRCVRPRDRWRLVRPSLFAPFPHGSIMFRRHVFWELGGYSEACAPWDDLDFYLRMSERGRIVVLPDALYRYRFHAGSTTQSASREWIAAGLDLVRRRRELRRPGRDGAVTSALLYYLGASRVWAGDRPGILKALIRMRPALSETGDLKALLLAVCGGANPHVLRALLGWFVRFRDRLARRFLRDGTPVEWRFE